ncbi:sulfatase [Pontibacter sp. G13]|uniref:sulfatase n=1 Tax=Pontibacter sp. G13 TaxID=3074898 RepID=UPI00288C0EC3|nr:sulfatase [Pontibacter sp. G13]WNJ20592.1 sulfatase [Pontibacter sp. G13]
MDIKSCLHTLLLLGLSAFMGWAQDTRPNVILLVADDLGWRDVGFMGSPYYQTPNLDLLASESLVIQQGYAGAANCAPSRAVLLSGQVTPRHGIYTVGNSDRGKAHTRKLIPTENTVHFADSMVTLAHAFQQAGYVTANIGKWHVSDDPTEFGIDYNRGGSHRGGPGKDGYFSPYNLDHLEDGPAGEYLTDRLMQEAIQFLETYQDSAFFLYMPFYGVHTPLIGKPELVDKYSGISPVNGQGHKPHYSAMIETLDQNVGRLLAALKRLDLDNTIIIFTSDNGGIANISRQWPYRAGKGSYYEGGLRVPLMFHWSGHIPSGRNEQLPMTFLDLYPTLLGLSDMEAPAGKTLDGNDLSPFLLGQAVPEIIQNRPLIWHFPIYLQAYSQGADDSRDPLFRTRPGRVIRQGNWKLHHYFEDDEWELFDLSQDPGERINLASRHPEKLNALKLQLETWREKYQAPIPTAPNPRFQSDHQR